MAFKNVLVKLLDHFLQTESLGF